MIDSQRIAAKVPCRCGPLSSNVRPLPNHVGGLQSLGL
jgi:hypothetical protein